MPVFDIGNVQPAGKGAKVNRNTLRIATVVLALTGLSGCAALQEGTLFDQDFWTIQPSSKNNEAELGIAELAKGNNVLANARFEKALAANPDDVLALYGLAVLYQNSGQPERARELYSRIVSMDPRPTDELLVWASKQTQPIVDLASVNMHLLNDGGMSSMSEAPVMGAASQSHQPLSAVTSSSTPRSQVDMMASQSSYMASPSAQMTQGMPLNMFKDKDLNIVKRFKILRSLLDQGLITQDEFVVRRKVNAGALLPISAPPPAAGLERPVPSGDQISSRLRAIGRALEMRALSPAQHTAERSMILDALMPMNPANLAPPNIPPRGLMEAADEVRRLELLKAEDLITSDEYSRERSAIESNMQPAAPQSMGGSSMGGTSKPQAMTIEPKPTLGGFQPALHLASYRQQRAAERGWAELSKGFDSILGGLEHRIERVDLGGGKGVFYRLKAGPMPSNAAAKDACRSLKAKRQYCEPTTINFG